MRLGAITVRYRSSLHLGTIDKPKNNECYRKITIKLLNISYQIKLVTRKCLLLFLPKKKSIFNKLKRNKFKKKLTRMDTFLNGKSINNIMLA